MSFIYKYLFLKKPFINVGTNEEKIIENFDEIKICAKFSQFREARNQILDTILQKIQIFLVDLKKCKNIYFWGTSFTKSKRILIIDHLWQRKFCFPDLLKAQQ